MDQNCYVRVTSDGWSTFQESQAIEESGAEHGGRKVFRFDYLLPINRDRFIEHLGRMQSKRGSVDSTGTTCSDAASETASESGSFAAGPGKQGELRPSFSISGIEVSSSDSGTSSVKNITSSSVSSLLSTQMSQISLPGLRRVDVPNTLAMAIVMRNCDNLFYDLNGGRTYLLNCNL